MTTGTHKRVKETTLRKLAGDVGLTVYERPKAGSAGTYLYLVRRVPGTNKQVWQYLCPKTELADLERERVDESIQTALQRVELAQAGKPSRLREPVKTLTPEDVLHALGTGAPIATIAERLGVSARSTKLRAILRDLTDQGKVRVGRFYEPVADQGA